MVAKVDFTGLVLSSRYLLRSQIGTGAFASVYLAHDIKTYDREVAVKVLHPEHTQNQDYVDRFRQEVRVAAKIATRYREHLVQIIDQGLDDGRQPALVYFVMEYVDGVSLRSLVSDVRSGVRVQRQLTWQRAVSLAQQLCRAIAPLHAHGVVHRDIKPENCLIERRSDRECIKLLDLGIAKVTADAWNVGEVPTTDARMVLGTPRYMAPEQMYGHDVDRRADIYAVGVILYEFLTGTTPRRLQYTELDAGMQPPEPRLPSEVAPDAGIPSALDAAVLQAIAWRREDRFVRAEALAAALEDASRSVPVRVRGITSRITQPFLAQILTRRLPPVATPPSESSIAVQLAEPPAEPAALAPEHARGRGWVRASRRFGGVMVGGSTVSGLVFVFATMLSLRPGPSRGVVRPALEEFVVEGAMTRKDEPGIRVTVPMAPPPVASPPAEDRAARRTTRPPMTREALIRRAQTEMRAECGVHGEQRLVEFAVEFADASSAVSAVKITGAWSGPQNKEFCACIELAILEIDFSRASDRAAAVRGTLDL
jgi:serine/threonine protein kinase